MNKSDLKNEMVVELKNGCKYYKIDNSLMREYGYMSLSSYNEDLSYSNDDNYSIVNVFTTSGSTFDTIFNDRNLKLIWERKKIINWNEIKKGTIILVRNYDYNAWEERKIIAYVEDLEYPFVTYRGTKQDVEAWKYAKLK